MGRQREGKRLFQGVEGSGVTMQCLWQPRGHQLAVPAVPMAWAAEATLGWVRGCGDSGSRGFLFETSGVTLGGSLLEMKNFAPYPQT